MNKYNYRKHLYRGIVVYNQDPQLKGRVKIYVPGIYPIQFKNKWQLLPWAQPALPLGGGNWANEKHTQQEQSVLTPEEQEEIINKEDLNNTQQEQQSSQNKQQQQQTEQKTYPVQLNAETGWCTVPHAGKYATDGAQVWVFFEAGDINKPIYFASAQSGTGWFSEHPNQHVFHSDNIRVRIDEDPYRTQSTCNFPVYNTNTVKQLFQSSGGGAPGSIPFMQLTDLPKNITDTPTQKAKLDIEILQSNSPVSGDLAVHLKVTGHVNIHITGDIYLQHIGNKIQTHIGDHFLHHVGNTTIFREGNINCNHIGNTLKNQTGSIESNLTGNQINVIQGNISKQREGNEIIYTKGNITDTLVGNKTETIQGNQIRTITGNVTQTFNGVFTKIVNATSEFTYKIINWTVDKLFYK